MKINILWLRRDLRLKDNTALRNALNDNSPLLTVFIFDNNIIDELAQDDPRITFIHDSLAAINKELNNSGSSVYVVKDEPYAAWSKILSEFDIHKVFINKDYEPYAIDRDNKVERLLKSRRITLVKHKDHVIFEENEVVKTDGKPYTVFTPYRNKWLKEFRLLTLNGDSCVPEHSGKFYQKIHPFPSLEQIGFRRSSTEARDYDLSVIREYHKFRDLPAYDRTSHLSHHLRFGTISIRKVAETALEQNLVFLSELIWREFFMQILFHFPEVIIKSFRSKYDKIKWRNNEVEFEKWCRGETGYPLVDAGMRQLNATGFMHNRVRMITAGFLCKHLLIDWRWGEAYFAQKLIDFELASNNGNWQWAAGTGCDAAPYFRVFNPYNQQKKFDPDNTYTGKWVPEAGKPGYYSPIVDHGTAYQRAVSAYKKGIEY